MVTTRRFAQHARLVSVSGGLLLIGIGIYHFLVELGADQPGIGCGLKSISPPLISRVIPRSPSAIARMSF